MRQKEPSFLSLNDDEGRRSSCKSEGGRAIFQKEFKKKAGYSRYKEQRMQRHRGMSKHDACKGREVHVTGQNGGEGCL